MTVQGIRSLKPFIRKNAIQLAVLTTPVGVSQTIANRLVDSGVKAIWNFSPTRLSAPSEVLIRNELISLGLAQVAYHLNGLREDDPNSLPTLDQPCKEPCRPMDE